MGRKNPNEMKKPDTIPKPMNQSINQPKPKKTTSPEHFLVAFFWENPGLRYLGHRLKNYDCLLKQ